MNTKTVIPGDLAQEAKSVDRYEKLRFDQYQERMSAYRDKHLVDLSDPQEPFYGEPWWAHQDRSMEGK